MLLGCEIDQPLLFLKLGVLSGPTRVGFSWTGGIAHGKQTAER